MTGTRTANIQTGQWIDTLLGNYNGSTRLIPLDRLIALLTALSGPTYATRAELYADRAWPANAIGRVYGDSTAAYNGVYKKSGTSGSGAWTRIADLPTAAVEAALIEEIRAELRTRRVADIWATDFSAASFPPGTTTVIQRQTNGNCAIWLSTADTISDGTPVQNDADGKRWVRVWSSKDVMDKITAEATARAAADTLRNQYSTRVYADRATAVADIANLVPGQTTRIATIEGQSLCWRAPFQNNNDPLSTASPYWGVVLRIDVSNADKTITALLAAGAIPTYNESRDGNVVSVTTAQAVSAIGLSGNDANSLLVSFPGTNTNDAASELMLSIDGKEPRPIRTSTGTIPAAGTITNRRLLLTKYGTTWRVFSDNPLEFLRAVLPVSGVIRTYSPATVSNDATGTVYSATSPNEYKAYGLSAGNAQIISFIPPTANQGPVTIIIDGGDPIPVLNRRRQPLKAGELINVPYLLHRWGTSYVVQTDVGMNDIDRLQTAIDEINQRSGEALSSTPFGDLNPTAGMRLWARDGETAGTVMADANFSVSDFVAVKADQPYCLEMPSRVLVQNYNLVSYYNADKEIIGCLVQGNSTPVTDQFQLRAFGLRLDADRHTRKYFRVKADGYVRITAFTADQTQVALREVSVDEYLNAFSVNISGTMKRDLYTSGYLYSAILTAVGRGYITTTINTLVTVGQERGMGEMIPVKAGQRVHAFSGNGIYAGTNSPVMLALYDANGELLVSRITTNGHASRACNAIGKGGLFTCQNVLVAVDGYARIITANYASVFNDQNVIFVTDDWLDYDYNWTSATRDVPKFDGASFDFSRSGINHTPNDLYTTYGPVFMKKGQVAKITTVRPGTGQHVALVWVDGKLNNDNGVLNRHVPYPQLYPNAIMPENHQCVRYVYATEETHVLLALSALGTGGIELISIEQARAERNEFLSSRAQLADAVVAQTSWPGGANNTSNLNKAWGYIPVFPGEVLQINLPTLYATSGALVYRDQAKYGETDEQSDGRAGPFTELCASVQWVNHMDALNDPSKPVTYLRPKVDAVAYFSGFVDQRFTTADMFSEGKYPVIITEEEFKAKGNIADGFRSDRFISFPQLQLTNDQWFPNANTGVGGVSNRDDRLRQSSPLYLRKGECIEWKMNADSGYQTRGPVVFYKDNLAQKQGRMVLHGDYYQTIIPHAQIGQFRAEHNCVFYLYMRKVGAQEAADTQYTRHFAVEAQMSARFITEEEYLRKTTAQFEGDILNLPSLNGVEFKFTNGYMPYFVRGTYNKAIMEIWVNGAFMTSLSVRNEVQGKASANAFKKNIDLKGYNKAGKRISFKIQDWKQTNKLTFKANMNDKLQIRDSLGSEIWRQCRRQHPYPYNQIWHPSDMTGSGSVEKNFLQDAVLSTQGEVVSVFYGDMFYGIYQLRTKKDPLNYAKDVDNPYDLMLESETMNFTGETNVIDWTTPSWKPWELASPEVDGYVPGYEPPTDTEAGNVANLMVNGFFDWVAKCISGETVFMDTYSQWINLDAWVDYIVFTEFVRHWDSARNNFVLVGNILGNFAPCAYDMDQILGNAGTGADSSPHVEALPWRDKGVQGLIYRDMKPRILARYAELRKSVFTLENLHGLVDKQCNTVASARRLTDRDIWGTNGGNGVNILKNWINTRITFLDNWYGYTGA